METKIIFDAATQPFAWIYVWSWLGAVAFGCVLVLLKRLGWRYGSLILGIFMIACGIGGAAYRSIDWYLGHQRQIRTLASSQYQVVQGIVEDFHPMPDDGSSSESFTISGHTFEYSNHGDAEPSLCFNQTRPSGGPIRQGMLLRVKYVNQCILQIETLPQNPSNVQK
jgi:hypothetical protein